MDMIAKMITDMTICFLENPITNSLSHDQKVNAYGSSISCPLTKSSKLYCIFHQTVTGSNLQVRQLTTKKTKIQAFRDPPKHLFGRVVTSFAMITLQIP